MNKCHGRGDKWTIKLWPLVNYALINGENLELIHAKATGFAGGIVAGLAGQSPGDPATDVLDWEEGR